MFKILDKIQYLLKCLLNGLVFDKICLRGGMNMEENNNVNSTEDEEVKTGEVVGADGYSEKEKEDGKLMAILSYIGFLAFVPYFIEKNNRWVRYHAIQGVNLVIIELILSVISLIPLLGWLIGWLGNIVMAVLSIIGIVNVCNGEAKELPIISKLKFIKK